MSAPVVSVLLPARDAAATVRRAVDSMLGQTVGALELVVVDDGSTDGTRDLLRAAAGRDPRVRLLDAGGRGLVAALNLGLAACRAPYVARMDADDESLPERLARSLAALLADPGLAAVGTQVEIFRDDRPVSPNMAAYGRWLNSLVTPERLYADRFVESPLCHPSVTFRREAVQAAGGFTDGELAEDYQLWLELLARGHRLRAVDEVLFRWRDHDGRLTRTDVRYSPKRLLRLKARYLAAGPLAETGPITVWGAGSIGLELTRLLESEGVEVSRFVDVSPRKVGQRIQGRPVVGPDQLGSPRNGHLLAAVGAKGAREQIREFLARAGWREGADFTCVA